MGLIMLMMRGGMRDETTVGRTCEAEVRMPGVLISQVHA